MRELVVATVTVFALGVLAGCAGYAVKNVIVQPPAEYPSSASNDTMAVAADPLDTAEESGKIFSDVDMNRSGYLVVNCIIENIGTEPFKVYKRDLYLVDRNGVRLLSTTADEMIQSVGASKAKWFFISGVVGAFSADRAKKKFHEDLRNKEFKNITIRPGVTYFGFLYFQHQVEPPQLAKGYKLVVANTPGGEPLQVLIR